MSSNPISRDNTIAWNQLIESEMLQTNIAISQLYQQIASYYSRIAKIGTQAATEILLVRYDAEQSMTQWNTIINARTKALQD